MVSTFYTHATYGKVCDIYVTHVLKICERGSAILFNGYDSTIPPKTIEQHKREVQNESADIIFEMDMVPTTSQTSSIILDGCDLTISTKALEQHKRAVQNESADIIFEVDMIRTTSQTSFLAESKNKQRLTGILITKFVYWCEL